MRTLRLSLVSVLAALSLSAPALTAEQPVAPKVRIVTRIDEADRVTLRGNTHPAVTTKNDQGRVSPSLPMTDLILVISRDPQQQAAFDKFVGDLYDPNSPDFHHWLTPEQVGVDFGPSETDIATLTNWLTGHGFTVTEVTKDRLSIRFNGTAAEVESTFHTEIHNLTVKGVPHVANISDPQIPAALASVVVGVKALHNFFPRPAHHLGSAVQRDSATGMWKRLSTPITARPEQSGSGARPASSPVPGTLQRPARPDFGISVGGTAPYLDEDLGPYDFATIYNVLPLWNATSPIDGTGQTIAIAGTSDIEAGQTLEEGGLNSPNDIATFRTFFGLPTGNAANTPIRKSGNSQPLTVCSGAAGQLCSIDDLLENTLDVEWSGSVAKNAQIILVASYPASTTDDALYDSESYIVNNLTSHIMNVSYGECEQANGTAGNVEYYDLWQTAAAEGISVFVAAGDSGSASCDQGGDASGVPYPAEYGTNVSGLASTPYNTAVGGTDFNWCPLDTAFNSVCTASPYWNATNSTTTNFNAKGYVPETPWNETCANPLTTTFLADFANQVYGIKSGISDTEDACNFLVENSSGPYGLGAIDYGILYLVNTVGGGGGASSCVVNGTTATSTSLGACTSGATSTGATTNPDTKNPQASLTVVHNGWPKPAWQTNAAIPGLPSDGVRDLPDVSFFASDGLVSGSAYLVCVSDVAACSYSTKSEPTAQEVGGTSVATPAMAGVMALINQKAGAAQGLAAPGLYALAAKQTYSNCSAESATTGNGCAFNDIDSGTNAVPCDYGAYVTSPSVDCNITNSGDVVGILPGYSAGKGYDQATGLGSLNVANVVNGWVNAKPGTGIASVGIAVMPLDPTSTQSVTVQVSVLPPNEGVPIPTGTVQLTAGTYTTSALLTSAEEIYFTVPAGSLSVGSNVITATYDGDVLYAAVTATDTVTVVQGTALIPTVTITPQSGPADSNAINYVTVAITGSGPTPTGTVTLTSGSFSTGAQPINDIPGDTGGCQASNCPIQIPANSLSAGVDSFKVTYSGDGTYASASATGSITVTASTFALAATTPAAITPGATATSIVTVSALGGYTGTVTLTCQEEADQSPTTGDGATCAIPTTVVAMGGNLTASVFTTAPVTAALRRPPSAGREWEGAGGGAVLAIVLFFGIPARRRSWRAMLGMILMMAALGSMAACGGGSSGGGGGGGNTDPGTTAGTYTFTVVATGNPSVTPTVQTTFKVVVN